MTTTRKRVEKKVSQATTNVDKALEMPVDPIISTVVPKTPRSRSNRGRSRTPERKSTRKSKKPSENKPEETFTQLITGENMRDPGADVAVRINNGRRPEELEPQGKKSTFGCHYLRLLVYSLLLISVAKFFLASKFGVDHWNFAKPRWTRVSIAAEPSIPRKKESGLPKYLRVNDSDSLRFKNRLALENGAAIVEVSPLPQSTSKRKSLVSSATSVYALSSTFPLKTNECWWLPPPTGSGFITLNMGTCVRPAYFLVQSVPKFHMRPATVSVLFEGNSIGEIRMDRPEDFEQDQWAVALTQTTGCVQQLTILVTGHESSNSNGTCVHRLFLMGDP